MLATYYLLVVSGVYGLFLSCDKYHKDPQISHTFFPKIITRNWECSLSQSLFPLFFFRGFHLKLEYVFQGLSILWGWFNHLSVLKLWHCYNSLLNLVAFLVIEFLALDLSSSSVCFGYCPWIEPYCYCFECCFYINQTPSIFSRIVNSLSTSALGCITSCACSEVYVFWVNLLQFRDFPVNNAKYIIHIWDCKTIDSLLLFIIIFVIIHCLFF